ncbi:hypothetical protein C8R44DRAFT_543311, partial [Mycena epipterygia]
MDSVQAADWLKENIEEFLAAMGGTSIFKQRHLDVFVEFVPVTFEPGKSEAHRTVEENGGLNEGDLAASNWVKRVHRRKEGQRVAHAIFGFANATAANHFLRYGLWVEGKKVWGRKHLSEPVRCMKCQGFGHVAAACKASADACARCGDAHRTEDCSATDEQRACANCKNVKRPHHGHGAADRACPVFVDKLQAWMERNPTARYPYFPVVGDPSSWV